MQPYIKEELVKEFASKAFFTRKNLLDFYRQYDEDLLEATFRWRVHELVKNKVIESLGRGIYTLSLKRLYQGGDISERMIKAHHFVEKTFNNVSFCIWNTSWINHFSRHQTFRNFTLLEIERCVTESLFWKFVEEGWKDVFLNPTPLELQRYVAETNNAIVIKTLISRSPLQDAPKQKKKIAIPTLEKLLVDLCSDKKTLYSYQGAERTYIFENALRYYSLNFTTLLNYAKRRGKADELKYLIKAQVSPSIKELIV